MPELYPFQEKGVEFLSQRRRGYLADRMGLGKSVQAIKAAERVGAQQPTVVCPASAVPNWRNEWDKWAGTGEPRFVSYSTLIRRDWKSWEPDLVIADEAHYAKSPSAQRTRAGLGMARRCVKDGGRAYLLSGTPMPNDPTELWTAIKYLWPEVKKRLGITRATQWRDHFCECRVTPYGLKPYEVKNGSELRDILFGDDPIMLRRTLDDVGLELPPLRVELSRLPKGDADTEALAEYEEWEDTDYTSTLRRLLGSVKAPLVAKQIIEELNDGAYEQIVFLYYHRDVGTELREAFSRGGISTVGFDGSTQQQVRQEEIDKFQTRDAQVFLAQQTAAGIAINLTAASEIVLLEPAWSPSENDQAIQRVHRIGQDRPCRARIFALSGTIDEAIMGTIRQKLEMRQEVGL